MNRAQRGVNILELINGILRERECTKKLNKERNSSTRLDTPLSGSSQHLKRPQRTEAMDQHKEKEGDNSEESTDQRKEEEDNSEESMDQRKGDEEENNSEEPTDQRKEEEESSEEAMAASSLFAHPCSLLQYIARVCACCLGFGASFSDPKPSAASDAPAPGNPSQEREDKKPSVSRCALNSRKHFLLISAVN